MTSNCPLYAQTGVQSSPTTLTSDLSSNSDDFHLETATPSGHSPFSYTNHRSCPLRQLLYPRQYVRRQNLKYALWRQAAPLLGPALCRNAHPSLSSIERMIENSFNLFSIRQGIIRDYKPSTVAVFYTMFSYLG